MHKSFLLVGVILGGLAVILGAFGAHGLQNITNDEKIIRGFQTGVQYQVYHAFALLVASILFEKNPHRFVKWAGYCFIAGIILFSGSLYLLTYLKIQDSEMTKIAGPITPIGGLFFILGWLFLLIGILKRKG